MGKCTFTCDCYSTRVKLAIIKITIFTLGIIQAKSCLFFQLKCFDMPPQWWNDFQHKQKTLEGYNYNRVWNVDGKCSNVTLSVQNLQ